MLTLDEFFVELKKEINLRKGIKPSDVYEVCHSSLPHEKKIESLEKLRDDSNNIFRLSNIALTNISREGFVSEMQYEKNKVRNNLFWQISLSLGFTAFNGYNIYEFIDYIIESQNLLQLQSQDLLKILVCILILPITSGMIDIKTIKNYISLKKYNTEINSYQKTLNNKHRRY